LLKNGHPSTPLADSPTRRRGKMSLLIRRDATLRISEALHLTLLSNLKKMIFSAAGSILIWKDLYSFGISNPELLEWPLVPFSKFRGS
jgi:hypothetical protein